MIFKDIYYYILIARSGLFDRKYYLSTYPDVRKADINPIWHYIHFGWKEGRNPSKDFNTSNYLHQYLDVKLSDINPLVHYIKFGKVENRNPIVIDSSKEKLIIDREKNNKINYYDHEFHRIRKFNIVPFYLDPLYKKDFSNKENIGQKIAIHIHLFSSNNIKDFFHYLNNIPYGFDLFISSSGNIPANKILSLLESQDISPLKIKFSENIHFEGDLISMINIFGNDLLEYEYIGHFHNKYLINNDQTAEFEDEDLNIILGSNIKIHQIFDLLFSDAKFVYPAPRNASFTYSNGWGEYYTSSKILLKNLLNENIDDYPETEFPLSSMFWAKSKILERFLTMKFRDFDIKQLDFVLGDTPEVIKRILLISANHHDGRNYRILSPESTIPSKYYESQNDYSSLITRNDIKVLSYYLPQFYPIPENDMWHGKGFTEWHKVRSSNPLFYDHYQQRVPHDDIGYYSLNTEATLIKQSEMMKQSGVYGQILYHYWFNGKLILEKPSKMLLANKSIEMPFCFCWANENWTRTWDGNEDEVLLAQKYSKEDAEKFINYLIPFFKDSRYIKVDDRPVIFIYRPSSIPNFEVYRTSWKKLCEKNGIPEPYIISVLTRGAKSPYEYKMDAGCERVLHNWTGGHVKSINNNLYNYWPIYEDVLNYEDVANYYIEQNPNSNFTYFRSLVPSWDNTPRYGSNALIVHNSTPDEFQKWLIKLIDDANQRLPDNQKFVVINAWNEWSESAYLEPDLFFGYAYLNSIGRALSEIDFNSREYLTQLIPSNLDVCILFDEDLLDVLKKDQIVKQKMVKCLANSTILSLCNISFKQNEIKKWIYEERDTKNILNSDKHEKHSDYILRFSKVCYFPPDMIENLLKMSLRYNVGIVSPTHANDIAFTHEHLSARWAVEKPSTYVSLIKKERIESIKCCVDADIFITKPHKSKTSLPKVNTIVRFSEKDNLKLLQNALYSLIAQVDCVVQPIIALNNLSDKKLLKLENLLEKIPWDKDCFPKIRRYSSVNNKDLRSLMLNDSLRNVITKYAAILDFDDILFFDAYSWLINRLESTQKKASFGLIYHRIFNQNKQQIVRRVIEHRYGKDYEAFINSNNTPVHGFMLNIERIDFDEIEYFDDMKYMEDYFLTLQIFDQQNTDWESLKLNKFIGDYVHYEDFQQTLGLLNENHRKSVLMDSEYKKCQSRINQLINNILREKI